MDFMFRLCWPNADDKTDPSGGNAEKRYIK